MKQAAYPSYKPTGVDWLEEVPSHWDMKRLRFAVQTNPLASDLRCPPDTLVSFVPMDAVGEYGGLALDQEKALDEIGSGYTYFRDDDVVVAKITPCFENGKGALAKGLKNGIAFGTTELHVLRARENLDPGFLFYLTISEAFRDMGEAHMYGAGGQKRVPELFIKDLRCPLPSVDEQQSIVRYLNEKLKEVDSLIEKKRALLEQLEERRASVITRAVSYGLENVEAFQETGFAWLPRVPAHWSFKRLRFLLREPLMYGANEAAEYEDPDWPRFIRITDVDSNGSLRDDTFKSLPPDVAAPYELVAGDILLARSGATVGKSFKYDDSWGRAAFAGYLIRARLEPEFSDFMTWYLRSQTYWEWVKGNFIQATIQNISAEKYSNLWVPVPPQDERVQIVEFIESEIAQIDNVRRSIEKAVGRLVEYKSSVITAAVTGKIKVV